MLSEVHFATLEQTEEMKIIECPQCHCSFPIPTKAGRPKIKTNILKIIITDLRYTHNVIQTANNLKCSEGTIRNSLKANGISIKDLTIRKNRRKEGN